MQLLAQIRANIVKGFESFPLLIGSFIGFIAIGLGNMALFLLFIGQFLLVPVAVLAMNSLAKTTGTTNISEIGLESGVDYMSNTRGLFSNISSYSFPSYWMGQLWFLVGYILSNAVDLYSQEIPSGTEDWRKIARQSKTGTLIASIVIIGVAFTILRYISSGKENLTGIIIGILFGGIGSGWYFIAKLCGARMSDIFGISSQMLDGGKSNKIMACSYPSVGSSTK